jgi:quercetin dioxygenase-like cupin family protein
LNSRNIFDDLEFSEEIPMKKILAKRDNFSILRLSLKKGFTVPAHKDSHAAFFLILKGKGIFTTEEGEVELRQNQYILIKENTTRGIQAIEDLILFTVKE